MAKAAFFLFLIYQEQAIDLSFKNNGAFGDRTSVH
jgi:hypothetical protein